MPESTPFDTPESDLEEALGRALAAGLDRDEIETVVREYLDEKVPR